MVVTADMVAVMGTMVVVVAVAVAQAVEQVVPVVLEMEETADLVVTLDMVVMEVMLVISMEQYSLILDSQVLMEVGAAVEQVADVLVAAAVVLLELMITIMLLVGVGVPTAASSVLLVKLMLLVGQKEILTV
jgi:hypothetical protein